jgi:hypothetical protein
VVTFLAGSGRLARTRLPLGPAGGPAPVPWIPVVAAGALLACAIAVAVAPLDTFVRACLAGSFVLLASKTSGRIARRRPRLRGWLVVDEDGVRRAFGSDEAKLVDWGEPFGATVLASEDRATLTIVLTTPHATRCVPAHVIDEADAAAAPILFERATTAADCDLAFDEGATLTAADAERLLGAIARRVPAALDRAYLRDAGGQPVVLDKTALYVGKTKFDLREPLEWRASVFQERGAQVVSVCQATWVRQGDAERVLVSPLADGTWVEAAPAEAGSTSDRRSAVRARHATRRDLHLMRATVGDPPPRELRCAIDRVFMLPLRRALDEAPRAPSVGWETSVSRAHLARSED